MYYSHGDLFSLNDAQKEQYLETLQKIRNAKRIVMKFGTDAVGFIFNGHGSTLAEEVAAEKGNRKEFLIVSSGAIGLGKESKEVLERDPVIEKSVYAALGQPILMNRWMNLLEPKGITVSQVLYENENLTGHGEHKEYIKKSIESAIRNGIIPIANENDAVTSEEIELSRNTKSFGDNDNLASLVSKLIGADLLIFFTKSGGIYKNIDDKETMYRAIFEKDQGFIDGFIGSKSKNGKGGLVTKLESSFNLAEYGVPVVVTSPTKDKPLGTALYGRDKTIIVPYDP